MKSLERAPDTQHPFAFGSFRNWLRLFARSGGIGAAYLNRATFVLLVSGVTAPLRWYERWRYGPRIRQMKIEPAPIFIIGHWRSGTTHLLNLMAQDPQFGYVPSYQVLVPEFSLLGEERIKAWIADVLPPTRVADNVRLHLDGPQEEEVAVADLVPYSIYHYWSFPRRADHFLRYALFSDVPAEEIERWRRAYLRVLRTAVWRMDGRRLLLKNPSHTGRVPLLLEMFPNAKFIHITRDPYRVFLSTRHFHRTMLAHCRFQEITPQEMEANVLRFYQAIMRKFLADQARIPAGQFIELTFEALQAAPLQELRRIYDRLGLTGYDVSAPKFTQYLASVADYRQNVYEMSRRVQRQVDQHWGFAFDAWGYEQRRVVG